MPKAYIETTIPSYYVSRPSNNLIQAARQAVTRIWWDDGCSGFDLFTSREVIAEVSAGDTHLARQRLGMIEPLRVLELSEEVILLAELLIESRLIPEKAASDAIHIAVATIHRMDYLVTWNFKHIANPHTRNRLAGIVERRRYRLPILCSPDELVDANENDD